LLDEHRLEKYEKRLMSGKTPLQAHGAVLRPKPDWDPDKSIVFGRIDGAGRRSERTSELIAISIVDYD